TAAVILLGFGGGSVALDALTDVDTSGVQDGDALVYDADTSTWIPGAGGGGGGNAYYDLQMGSAGSPSAGAADGVLVPRAVTIDDADPGEVYVGVNPTSDPAVIDIEVNGTPVGSIEIEDDGTVTWDLTADIELEAGDGVALVAPDPAGATRAGAIGSFEGVAARAHQSAPHERGA